MQALNRIRVTSLLGLGLWLPLTSARDTREVPHVDRAEPTSLLAGDVVVAFGEHLDRSHVADVILGNVDVAALTHIIEQKVDFIRFRIPKPVAPGRYSILLAPAGNDPSLLDQRVYVTVKE
jgi:hypothetical protein